MPNQCQMPKPKDIFDIFPPHYYKVYSGRDPAEAVRILDLICH